MRKCPNLGSNLIQISTQKPCNCQIYSICLIESNYSHTSLVNARYIIEIPPVATTPVLDLLKEIRLEFFLGLAVFSHCTVPGTTQDIPRSKAGQHKMLWCTDGVLRPK